MRANNVRQTLRCNEMRWLTKLNRLLANEPWIPTYIRATIVPAGVGINPPILS